MMLYLSILSDLIIVLLFTLILEYFIIVKVLKIPIKLFVATNVLTNVLANIVVIICDFISIYSHIGYNRMMIVLIIECLVVVVESFIYVGYYKKKNVFKVTTLTIVANFVSAYVGTVILNILMKQL